MELEIEGLGADCFIQTYGDGRRSSIQGKENPGFLPSVDWSGSRRRRN